MLHWHIMRAELAMLTDNCFEEKGVKEREESGILSKILAWTIGYIVVPLMKMGKTREQQMMGQGQTETLLWTWKREHISYLSALLGLDFWGEEQLDMLIWEKQTYLYMIFKVVGKHVDWKEKGIWLVNSWSRLRFLLHVSFLWGAFPVSRIDKSHGAHSHHTPLSFTAPNTV